MRGNGTSPSIKSMARGLPGRVVLVLQGGGALGSYQAGVYQALHEAGIEPGWIIGTSIGAINASLIAGNPLPDRLPQLREFWKRMERNPIWNIRTAFPEFNDRLSYWTTVTQGIPSFFTPNPLRMLVTAILLVRSEPAIIPRRRWRKRLPSLWI